MNEQKGNFVMGDNFTDNVMKEQLHPKTELEDCGCGRGEGAGKEGCKVARLCIIVGKKKNKSLQGAEKWVQKKAKRLGGTTYLWRDYSNSDPLGTVRVADLSDSDIKILGKYYEYPTGAKKGFDKLLPGFQSCKGRIEELLIFHHGTPVDESELATQLITIFDKIKVPVCKIIWWSCHASNDLDVKRGHWTDVFMMRMGANADCKPCGCDQPIELIWPTEGKCYIDPQGDKQKIMTNDGKVNRMRWGYNWGGKLHVDPDPSLSHTTRWPNDREPEKNTNKVKGLVFGQSVSKK